MNYRSRREILNEELYKIIENHEYYLYGDYEGFENMRACIVDANIINADLSNKDLSKITFVNVVFHGVNFSMSVLDLATIIDCHFMHCTFFGTSMGGSNIAQSFFGQSSFEKSTVNSSLFNVSFDECGMHGVSFINSTFVNVRFDNTEMVKCRNVPYIPFSCPTSGSFIGWKKVGSVHGPAIAKLEIPEDAKRLSGSENKGKCRCDKAKVISIETIRLNMPIETAYSIHAPLFVYKVGEMVSVPDFDENRWNTCSTGIHFFVDKQAAINY